MARQAAEDHFGAGTDEYTEFLTKLLGYFEVQEWAIPASLRARN